MARARRMYRSAAYDILKFSSDDRNTGEMAEIR
jgi:hypothetical protein